MLVEELMTTDVVTVDREGTLADAARQLLDHGVGSVVITDDETPIGILTETDLIRAGYETGDPLAAIDVLAVGRRPVVTTEPTATVSRAADRMASEGVKKIPVVDGLELVGMLTFTDVVYHLSDIRREAGEVASARDRWEDAE